MSKFVLSCCSTADLTHEHFIKRDIHYVSFHYLLDGVTYPDDLGKSMPFHKFYQAMENGAVTKTSQVNVDEFVNYFSEFLDKGMDILHVSLSSGLSGAFNSAQIARDMLVKEYPDRKIYIVDSLGASSGYGLLMETLADKRDSGADIDELYSWISENRLKLHHWFFSTDLKYYVKGGRITKTAGFVGTLLGICPLLNIDNEGHLIPRSKVRGKKNVIKAIVDRMEECADDGLDYSGKCFISQSDCMEDAQAVAELIEQRFKKLDGKVLINYVGTTIGSHTGPGTVALFFWGAERKN